MSMPDAHDRRQNRFNRCHQALASGPLPVPRPLLPNQTSIQAKYFFCRRTRTVSGLGMPGLDTSRIAIYIKPIS
jgi:hypothetical protein